LTKRQGIDEEIIEREKRKEGRASKKRKKTPQGGLALALSKEKQTLRRNFLRDPESDRRPQIGLSPGEEKKMIGKKTERREGGKRSARLGCNREK